MTMGEKEQVILTFGETGGFPRENLSEHFDSYTIDTVSAVDACLQENYLTSTIHEGTGEEWLVPTTKGVRQYVQLTD